jgi:hypothetical protein
MDLQRVRNGIPHVRPRRRAYLRQDAIIHDADVALNQGRLNIAQFLQRVSHCMDNLIQTLREPRRLAPELGAEGEQPPRRAADPEMPPHLLQLQPALAEVKAIIHRNMQMSIY